jgi:hypothetical protein
VETKKKKKAVGAMSGMSSAGLTKFYLFILIHQLMVACDLTKFENF